MSRTAKFVTIACAAMIPVALLAGLMARSRHVAEQEVARAAVEQYEARTGRTGVSALWVDDWRDCAIIQLGRGQEGLASVAMQKIGSRWVTGRSTEESGVGFDSDDIDSRNACLVVAGSTGYMTNGEPD
jgi:hypothetical protein